MMKHNQLIEYLEQQLDAGGYMVELENVVVEQLLEILGSKRSEDPRFLVFRPFEILDQLDSASEILISEGYTLPGDPGHVQPERVLCILDTWSNQYVWTDNQILTLADLQYHAKPNADLMWIIAEGHGVDL